MPSASFTQFYLALELTLQPVGVKSQTIQPPACLAPSGHLLTFTVCVFRSTVLIKLSMVFSRFFYFIFLTQCLVHQKHKLICFISDSSFIILRFKLYFTAVHGKLLQFFSLHPVSAVKYGICVGD